ncbi:MAG: response regulator [Flavobacteriales bacterium]|nr:response regulator [Flavobacteriales bacterium]
MDITQLLNTNRIAIRVWLVLALVYLASVILITFLLFQGFRTDTLETASSDMYHRLDLARLEQLQKFSEVQQHVEVLAKAPQVNGYIEHFGKDTDRTLTFRNQTEELFAAYLSTYPEYFQLRLLSASSGKEMVRLSQKGDAITVVPQINLQQKGDRPYFKEALSLSPEQLYFSQFDLNQEHGELSFPYIKTIRVATPIASNDGITKAVLVINVNASFWFDQVASYSQPDDSLYMLDDQGNFLFHPTDSLTFLGYKPKKEFQLSEFDQSLRSLDSREIGKLIHFERSGDKYAAAKMQYSYGRASEHTVRLVLVIRHEYLFAGGRDKVQTILFGLVAALVGGLVLLLWLSKSLLQPIRDLDERLTEYAPGGPLPNFNLDRSDELGSLGSTFATLAERVNKQIEELDEARTKAEELAAGKEAFLGNFSHELRTPLNSIVGMAEVLLHKPHSKEQLPALQTLKYSVEHLSALISDVLDFNKILEKELQLSQSIVVPEELARNLYLAHDLKAKSRQINLSYKVTSNVPPAIETDKVRVLQIVNNLLGNALKFTKNGSVSLMLDWEDNELVICVEDTGSGMKKDELGHIFDRYHQAESGRKSRSGLGLGLAIVKHLVALFDGDIEVESTLGQGSKFTVSIPAKQAGPSPGERVSASSSLGKDLSALYVDDVAVNRITMQHYLEAADVRLESVESCTEALVALDQQTFDVILMDLRMPEIDGFECIKHVQKVAADTPIIAVSANLGDKELNQLAAMGIHHSIEKPIDQRQLFTTILHVTNSTSQSLFNHLMADYCDNDPALLKRIVSQFQTLLASSRKALDEHSNEVSETQVTDLIQDLKHKLHPTIVMFGQLETTRKIWGSHVDPSKGMLNAIDHLTDFLDRFVKDQVLG